MIKMQGGYPCFWGYFVPFLVAF
jgi:hypothetical protein